MKALANLLNPKEFIKMQGVGNSFVIIQQYEQSDKMLEDLAKKLCHPRLGIGADSLLVLAKNQRQSQRKDFGFYMRVFNADGSFAQMCGNGLRCFSAFLVYKGFQKAEISNEEQKNLEMGQKSPESTGTGFEVMTDAGLKKVKVFNSNGKYNVKIEMGLLDCRQSLRDQLGIVMKCCHQLKFVSATLIVFNVPHLVIFVEELPSEQKIKQYGRSIQNQLNANVNFALLQSSAQQSQIKLRTFERGCGLTLGCGTGACATFAVARHSGRITGSALLNLDGGQLKLSEDKGQILMEGPAEFICFGEYN